MGKTDADITKDRAVGVSGEGTARHSGNMQSLTGGRRTAERGWLMESFPRMLKLSLIVEEGFVEVESLWGRVRKGTSGSGTFLRHRGKCV